MLGDQADAQLVIEPIVGWRGWKISEGGQLVSPQQKDEWPEGQLAWDGVCRCPLSKHDEYRRQLSEIMVHMAVFESEEACFYNAAHVLAYMAPLEMTVEHLTEMLAETECHCGINAFDTPDTMREMGYFQEEVVAVIGEVALTGVVRRYTRGWRAQEGKVLRIWAAPATDERQAALAAASAGAVYMGAWEGPTDPRSPSGWDPGNARA